MMVVRENSILQVQGAISFHTAQFCMPAASPRKDNRSVDITRMSPPPKRLPLIKPYFLKHCQPRKEINSYRTFRRHKSTLRVLRLDESFICVVLIFEWCARRLSFAKTGSGVRVMCLSPCSRGGQISTDASYNVDARWRLNFLAQQPWQLVSHSHRKSYARRQGTIYISISCPSGMYTVIKFVARHTLIAFFELHSRFRRRFIDMK